MNARATRAGFGVLLVIALAGAAPLPNSVARVQFSVPDEQRVGKQRSGVLCAPAGAFKLSDVRPPAGASVAVVSKEIHALVPAQVEATDEEVADLPATGRYRIVATVTKLDIAACRVTFGVLGMLGKRPTRWRGEVKLSVTWQRHEIATRTLIDERTTDVTLPFDDARSLAGDVVLPALAEAAQRYARAEWPDRARAD